MEKKYADILINVSRKKADEDVLLLYLRDEVLCERDEAIARELLKSKCYFMCVDLAGEKDIPRAVVMAFGKIKKPVKRAICEVMTYRMFEESFVAGVNKMREAYSEILLPEAENRLGFGFNCKHGEKQYLMMLYQIQENGEHRIVRRIKKICRRIMDRGKTRENSTGMENTKEVDAA